MQQESRQPNPTSEQIEERIEFLRAMIGTGKRKNFIKGAFRQKFGPADATTIERYLTKAKNALMADIGRGKNLKRAEKSEFYRDVYSNGKMKMSDRLRASELDDKIHGLQQHSVEVSGPDGGPIGVTAIDVTKLTEEEQDIILKADAIMSREREPISEGGETSPSTPEPSRNGHFGESGEV